MSTANGTVLRPLTPIEEKAVQLWHDGTPLATVTGLTNLTTDQITVAIARHSEWERLRNGAKTTRAYVKRDAAERVAAELNPAPTVPDMLPVPKPTPVEPPRKLPSAALLLWADQSGPARAKTLAARIRESPTELYALHAGDAARAAAAAEVARLTAELDAAKARLREAGGKSKPASTVQAPMPPGRKAYLAEVRAWARARGDEVSDLGRVPAHIEAAYQAAHGGTS